MKEIIDIEKINQYLNQYGLEDVFPEPLRQRLALYRFEPEEALCLQGEEPQFLFLLVQGKVKVYTTSTEGKTLLISFTNPLGIIGEIECLRDRENLNTVTAVSQVETIGVHKRWLTQYGLEASFLRFLLDMVTEKFYTKSISLSSSLLYPVEVRLASYLLSVSYGDEGESFSRVSMSNMKDTANLIGTSYRHLNRVLQSFCSAGLVERRKGKLAVIDRKGLTAVAGRNIYENGERRKKI
jgi:CRP-like cAMP-binding protein